MDDTAAWAALLKVHASLVPLLDRELQAAHRLPLTWYDVLLELRAAADGRLTMGELGEAAVVSRSRVSRVVDELVRDGLVRRDPNPKDQRSAYAVITDAGRARLRAAAPTYLAGIKRHFTDRLTAREAETIAKALTKVLTAKPEI
jgi:DNA-binding MarR family transcriptional regulator